MRQLIILFDRHSEPVASIASDEALSYLTSAQDKNPGSLGELKSLQLRIKQSLTTTDSDEVSLVASQSDRIEAMHLRQMISFLLAQKKGHLYCSDCKRLIEGTSVIFERYVREKTTGKRFFCREYNHLMLEMIDLKRAGEANKLAEEFSALVQGKELEIF